MVFIMTVTQHLILFLLLNYTIKIMVWEYCVSFQAFYICCASSRGCSGPLCLASAKDLFQQVCLICGLPSYLALSVQCELGLVLPRNISHCLLTLVSPVNML